MSFDPDALMRDIRAIATRSAPLATIATLRQTPLECRNVANVASSSPDRNAQCRNVANVAGSSALACDPDHNAIEERAGIAADRVPALYIDAWARLNYQKPFAVSDAEWRLALDDGGRFLDAWGEYATALGWTPGELFDVPREGRLGGLVWRLAGERVEALGPAHVRLGDGRTIMRGESDPGPQA